MKNTLFCFLLLASSLLHAQGRYPKRDFRAAWVTTVANIDWPSKQNLTATQQKNEVFKMLWHFKKFNFNAVFFQVRPSADAFYASKYEPWSQYLNGRQGKAPSPYYDPLEFWVTKCHERNLEFHAWFNPFRAVANLQYSHVHDKHITKLKPHWFFNYGGKKYFNPGIPEVRKYLVKIIMDVVKRYDIDGVHFDDYFYPYKIPGKSIPDSWTFRKYPNGIQNIEQWRRNNINLFVKEVHEQIQATKPHVKFGVSPVGAWRNKRDDPRGSSTRIGQPAYDYLYADTRKWLRMGWVDYMAPQLYWSTNSRFGKYRVLVSWWHHNAFGRHIYTGNAAFRVGDGKHDPSWASRYEMGKQLRINDMYSNVKGAIYFSTRSIMNNPLGMLDTLRKKYYKYPALVPAMPWKDKIPPNRVRNLRSEVKHNGAMLRWDEPIPAEDNDTATYYVVYRFDNELEVDYKDMSHLRKITRKKEYLDQSISHDKRYYYTVIAVDRLHNESDAESLVYCSKYQQDMILTSPRRKIPKVKIEPVEVPSFSKPKKLKKLFNR